MSVKLENRVAIWSLLVAMIMIGVVTGSLLSTARFLAISVRVERSHHMIELLKDLKSLMKDRVRIERSRLAPDIQEDYQKQFADTVVGCQRVLEQLPAAANGVDVQQSSVRKLRALFSREFGEPDGHAGAQPGGGPEDSSGPAPMALDDPLMLEIDNLVDDMERFERGELNSSGGDAQFARSVSVFLSITKAVFTVIILAAVTFIVRREMRERRRAEEEFARACALAEAASRAKGVFMANVSHEIRTPMNAIVGMTELTLVSDLTEEQRENLMIVKCATDSLMKIINDLLDFSKMDAGKLELTLDEFSLRDSLADTLDILGLKAFDKGLELACRVDPRVPERLRGDALRLRQVMMNLVGNAIKFTARGEVVVEVDVEHLADQSATLHFRVTDTGIGISPEKREMIFAPFTQADDTTTRLYGGTGLGLAISSQVVELMGGRIWLESEVGLGSTFHFTANLSVVEVAPPHQASTLESLRGLKVLVVDDNAMNRRILKEILTFWQMETTLATNGREAIAELERARDAGAPFVLVLLDALMPEIDGFWVAEQIKIDPSLNASVLLMLTSSDRQGFVERARRAGIAACLSKPLHQNKLLNTFLAIVTQGQGSGNAHEPRNSRKSPGRPLKILMAEDNPFNQRVVLLLLAKAGHVVTVVNNGSEAVAAVDRQRFDVVLMDLQMPVMDGLQATAAIRASETGNSRHVPIIALTAHARKEDEECCLAAGMDGYISKPIREDQLYQAIEKCVSKWSIDPFNKKPCTERAGPTPSADLAAALDRVDGDRGFLGQMVAMFLEEAPALLEKIRHSVARRAGEALVAPAHTLKNWTGNFMAAAAIDALDRLEAAGRAGDWHAAAAAYAELEREFERLTRALEQFDAVPEVTADGDVALLCCEDRRSSPCTL